MDRAALCIRGRGLLVFVEKRGMDECEKLGCDENFPSRLWEGGQADVKYRGEPSGIGHGQGHLPGDLPWRVDEGVGVPAGMG